jgi:hypothetical protein
MPEEVFFPPPGDDDDDDDPSSSLPKEIIDAIAIGNVKSVAEQSSMLSNLAYANLITNTNLAQQNAVSNQQALNQLGATVTGKSVNLIANLSPLEAVASVKLDTGNDIAEQLSDLKGTLEAFGPAAKVKPGA